MKITQIIPRVTLSRNCFESGRQDKNFSVFYLSNTEMETSILELLKSGYDVILEEPKSKKDQSEIYQRAMKIFLHCGGEKVL